MCFSGEMLATFAFDQNIVNCKSSLVIGDVRWTVQTTKTTSKHINIYVCPEKLITDVTMNVDITVIGQNTVKDGHFTHTYSANKSDNRYGLKRFMSWETLRESYLVNGEVTIGVKLSVFVPPTPSNFNAIIFPDLILVCDNVEFRVNKCVVGSKSELICRWIESKDEWGKTDTFPVNHASATSEILKLVLMIMYDGWDALQMDKHAVDIFIVGDFLLSDVVVDAALVVLKRKLSANTFWAISSVAVALSNRSELLEACVLYASTPSLDTWFDLLNTPDGQAISLDKTNDTTRLLTVAMAHVKKN